ncbi:MAG: extracellular solute-binding protein [Huintestinicola sp.]|uniref:sugar ABC transporter substrate-binding protein n=1 Tax=Huintestinicola sp. TaxID=2981661 RepID=UPI003F09394B
MKKRILASVLALSSAAMMFAGCGSQTDSSTDTAANTGADAPAASSGEPVTLKVWESVDGPDKWIQQAGEKFTEQNPNIKIEFVNVELGDSTSAIALDGPAGTGPDLFAAPHDKLGELVVGGHILPTADADSVKGQVLGSCSSALTYDGTMYGYPTSAETYALFYNRALISDDEVPKNWDDLYTWGQSFREANPDKYPIVMDVTSIYYTILFTTGNGNRLFGASGADTSSSYLNTDDAVNGMKMFQKLHDIIPVASADLGTDTADGAFKAGTAAMHITGPWNVASFTEAGIDFGVTTIPSLTNGGDPAASFSGTRGMFVSAYSDHPEEAAQFAQFLITDEMQQLRYEITGALPSTNIAVDSEAALGFIAQLDYAFPMPSVPQMTAFWESSGSASCNIWDGADVKTELDALDSAITANN